MSWFDAIALARRSVGRRLGRALLTVLAVALGTALLSSLLIASEAAKHRVLDQVSAGGPLAGIRVDAALPDPNALDTDNPRKGAPRAIDDRAIESIRRVPNVQSIVPVLVTPALVVPPVSTGTSPAPFFDAMVGVDLARVSDLPVNVVAGRLPDPAISGEAAVTLGYLHRLGLRDADAGRVVGTDVQLGAPRAFGDGGDQRPRGRWTRVEIVGVVSQEAGNGQVLVPFNMARDARAWTTLGAALNRFGSDPSPYTTLFVVAHGLSHVADVRAAINTLGYSTAAPETLITSVQRYVHIVEIVLAGIGLIGLTIAALGITNAMLAAVRERRREIGVLKAVGAADRDVRRVFLVEAGALGFLGGIVGTVVGLAAARLLAGIVNNYLASQHLASVRLGMPVSLLFIVVFGATLLALLAGALPAQRAARLPARQAMGDR